VRIAAVLLAAGASTRFGPRNKLLAHLHGKPLVRHAAEQLAAAGLADVVAVTGPDAEEIAAAMSGLPIRLVANTRCAGGMGSSIAAGIAALRPDTDGALIVPGDMPNIRPALIASLVSAFCEHGGNRAAFPVLPGGRQSPPVLWPRHRFPELAGLDGPRGGKLLLQRTGGIAVPVADPRMLADIDTPDDLASAGQRPPTG
jgi:molybdenum cofactor cytidylyltransferase